MPTFLRLKWIAGTAAATTVYFATALWRKVYPTSHPEGALVELARGKDRFAYWTEVGFIFPSNDSANPLTNGRIYWVVIRPAADQPL